MLRLLKLGLSLLQCRLTPSHGLSKTVLRERIYASALDYFSAPPQHPVQRQQALRDDILVLADFFRHMYNDRKHYMYLREQEGTTAGATPSRMRSAPCIVLYIDFANVFRLIPACFCPTSFTLLKIFCKVII